MQGRREAPESSHDAVVLKEVKLHLVLREQGHAMAPPLKLEQQSVQDSHLAARCNKVLTCGHPQDAQQWLSACDQQSWTALTDPFRANALLSNG